MTKKMTAAERAAYEAAARICEEHAKAFLSTKYATNQPSSSFSERFACGACARAIREAASIPDPQGA